MKVTSILYTTLFKTKDILSICDIKCSNLNSWIHEGFISSNIHMPRGLAQSHLYTFENTCSIALMFKLREIGLKRWVCVDIAHSKTCDWRKIHTLLPEPSFLSIVFNGENQDVQLTELTCITKDENDVSMCYSVYKIVHKISDYARIHTLPRSGK